MRLEVRSAKLSRQAIMRGRKQMPLKVVPVDSAALACHRTFVSSCAWLYWFKIRESAFRIHLHNALGFSMAGAVADSLLPRRRFDPVKKIQLPIFLNGG
jgi:hypothetical protein